MTPDVVVYSARLVLPITAPPIVEGAVAVRDGRILHVGDRAWVRELLAERGEEHHEVRVDGILMPGLVNAHSHLQYTGMAEVGRRRHAGFEDWGAAFDAVYEPGARDWHADAVDGARQMIRAGITSVADIVTDAEALGVLGETGLNGITYWEVMSWTNADWRDGGRDRIVAELDRIPLTPGAGLSPHAPYSLDTEPLLEIPDLVRQRGLRTHLHLGESALEGHRPGTAPDDPWRFVKVDSFRSLRDAGFGASATEFVDQLGVLGPDCHIAHGVYMTATDRALLRARGTSVALCPRSNEVIGLDEPPVAAYLVEGSPLAVGTDSLSSSPSLDLMADVAALVRIARSQGYTNRDLHARLLAIATLGGARALGLDVGPDRTGYLAVGARADLAFFAVDGDAADGIAALAEDAAGRCVGTVIAGELAWAPEGSALSPEVPA
ncbi:amidohydrolase family protein [Microbacterium gorillae]|uniref:amidohydrolase family protein n=1 Tax=Microbacterium gorillae TaxID=1231063 RepID=UPI00058B48A3|nr:amidohydrolase family protein [Microbacterium gorillae]